MQHDFAEGQREQILGAEPLREDAHFGEVEGLRVVQDAVRADLVDAGKRQEDRAIELGALFQFDEAVAVVIRAGRGHDGIDRVARTVEPPVNVAQMRPFGEAGRVDRDRERAGAFIVEQRAGAFDPAIVQFLEIDDELRCHRGACRSRQHQGGCPGEAACHNLGSSHVLFLLRSPCRLVNAAFHVPSVNQESRALVRFRKNMGILAKTSRRWTLAMGRAYRPPRL